MPFMFRGVVVPDPDKFFRLRLRGKVHPDGKREMHRWTYLEIPRTHPVWLDKMPSRNAWGWCSEFNEPQRYICVATGIAAMSAQQKLEVVWHELLHAFWVTKQRGHFEFVNNEGAVSDIGHQIAYMMWDNRAFAEYLDELRRAALAMRRSGGTS